MTDPLNIILALVGMAAIAFIAWKLVGRQESGDPKFRAKLDADDERARKGRERSGIS